LEDDEQLIIYSIGALGNTPLRGRLRLQKLLFLISNVFENFKALLEFEPHLYGPYSEAVDDILDDLISLGLIDKEDSRYVLTKKGIDIYNHLKSRKELVDVIEDFKNFLKDLSGDEILVFVYVLYPEYIGESIVWDDLKKDRIKIAKSLLRKEKISFGKASEIAGLGISEFEGLLKEENIRWRT
jgi:Uncharacterised protein family (UPF0175).